MRWLTMTLLVLLPPLARADEAPEIQDIPPGEDQIEVVHQGKAAPFTGQLFSQETALRWANWLTQYKLRLDQDVQLERRLCSAELKFKDATISIEEEKNMAIRMDLRERILRVEELNAKLNDEINDPSFFGSVEFGVILGVVGSAAVAVAVGVAAASN